jgi:hypothetical protein
MPFTVYALLVSAVPGVCCTQLMLYLVYAVFGVYCTRCMLYLVYDVLTVNSRLGHSKIGRDNLTLGSTMMIELSMTMGEMGDEYGNHVEGTGGYKK